MLLWGHIQVFRIKWTFILYFGNGIDTCTYTEYSLSTTHQCIRNVLVAALWIESSSSIPADIDLDLGEIAFDLQITSRFDTSLRLLKELLGLDSQFSAQDLFLFSSDRH